MDDGDGGHDGVRVGVRRDALGVEMEMRRWKTLEAKQQEDEVVGNVLSAFTRACTDPLPAAPSCPDDLTGVLGHVTSALRRKMVLM